MTRPRGNGNVWLAGLVAIAAICGLFVPRAIFAQPAVVGDRPIRNILKVRNAAEAAEALRRELPKAAGRLILFSPHDYLAEIILPLHREGVLQDLVAVLPAEGMLTPASRDGVRAFLEAGGVAGDDRATFVADNGTVTGRIGRLSVVLCTPKGLRRPEMESVVALDTAFLAAMYRDDVKTPMVALARKLVATMRARLVTASAVVIFDASGRPDFPLDFGYLPTLLKEIVSAPESFAAAPPEKWRLLAAAETGYFFMQFQLAAPLYARFLELAPGEPSACYRLAWMAARDLEVDAALPWLARAASDPPYRRGYAEIAEYLFRKGRVDGAERVLRAGLAAFPKDPVIATNLAGLYLASGVAAGDAGDLTVAARFFDAAAKVEGADPLLIRKARSMGGARPGRAPQ